ncbi:MAG TPA: S8 family serine peptidase, partial [Verrucomicrobiae bacterium]|nr:S8 family serine peptidase [Verrucomicrobiae bacterium]
MPVNPNLLTRRILVFWLVCAFFCVFGGRSLADQKLIRLRNEVITTSEPSRIAPQLQTVEKPVSGLYLLQFTGHFQPVWGEQLRAAGVRLLRYVPDDAYIVRLSNASIGQLKRLSFVQWAGPYRPEHKLQAKLGQVSPTNSAVGVRVLLTPDASTNEINQVKAIFKKLGGETKLGFGTILTGETAPAQLNVLAQSANVLWLESDRKMKLQDEIATKIILGGEVGDDNNHLAEVQAAGYDGRGTIVSVADSGLYNGDDGTMHPDLEGRVDAFFFYPGLDDASDEHGHGSHVAGIIAADGATGETDDSGALYGLGVAPKTHLVVQRVFDGEGNDHLPPYDVLTRDAVRAGAVIGSNSWGDDTFGVYDLSAAQFDSYVRDADLVTPGEQPYILEFSAGNSGPGAGTIGTPAVGKNVIATGASENNRFDMVIYSDGQETMADFSSRGPCADGRIKPDVVAPGTWISSLASPSALTDTSWLPISDNYVYEGGTSQAGPHVSGCAAIFVQYYRQNYGGETPSPALTKAALINSAVDMGGEGFVVGGGDDEEDPVVVGAGDTGPVPNMDEGWGRVDMTQIIGSSRVTLYLDQTTNLTTGKIYEQKVVVGSRDEPFKVTLTYTDVPGLPAAIPALVNDLDLELVAPDGSLYRGNQFFNGESVPGVPVGDRINNVEGFLLSAPSPGEWTVRVRAVNVVEDIHHRTNNVPEQDFALVISGDLPPPGAGVIFLDRLSYRAPATAQVQLVDFDLAAQSTVSVQVTSTVESSPETLVLKATSEPGIFTNSIPVVLGAAVANDGKIEVISGATITVTYQDASPVLKRTTTATVDNTPPAISSVVATNRFGKTTIEWTTDEPASSYVYYGPPGSPTQVQIDLSYDQTHSVSLPAQAPGTTNVFYVVSYDEAGNVTTNNNGGKLYTFVTEAAKPVLLVYAEDSLFDLPTIDTYTSSLDELGVEYELWDMANLPFPTFDDLKPYRVVMWRPAVFDLSGTPIPASAQAAITSYVTNGGSFFMAAMEVLSGLTTPSDLAFRSNILQVVNFAEDAGTAEILGTSSDVIGEGIDAPLDYSGYPDLFGVIDFETLPDHITVSTNASVVFRDADSGQPIGLRYPRTGQDSKGRVVFFSFALESVPDTADAPNNRVTILGNVLKFLAPEVEGSSSIALDSPAYTIPAAATVEVADVHQSGKKHLSVTVTSTGDPSPQTISLDETVRPGIFRGTIGLVATNAAPASGKVRARDGDTITASYTDTVANKEARASAVIDTVKADISEVASDPDYNEATISWQTSEDSDALVRFGESNGDPSFLTRTAYSSEFTTYHELLLTGLLPDHDYYFQVVSRDIAGNASVSGGAGTLYHFRTLKPIEPPWFDDLENGDGNWVVIDGSSDLGDLGDAFE